MKTILPYLFLPCLVLLATRARAQYSETFETAGSLTSNCMENVQFDFTNGADAPVIHGLGSAYTNPPTNGSGSRSLNTPFLRINNDPLTVSFYYQISSKINGNATRLIEVGLVDRTGTFTSLDQFVLNNTTPVTALFYNRTFPAASRGIQRLGLRITGATGDGNSRLIFDDLYSSAPPFYGPTNYCNSAPQAINDNYFPTSLVPVAGNVITDNAGADQEPNGESLSATLLTSPPATQGTLSFSSDGSFSFTPAVGFTGGLVTFTYRISDGGYPTPLTSQATVTLSYLISALPVQLTEFSARLVNGHAELAWSVAGNEDARHFTVERSTDGRHFTAAGRITASVRSGRESYGYTDAVPVLNKVLYRLRITGRQGEEAFSRSVLLQTDAAGVPLQLQYSTAAAGPVFTYHTVRDEQVTLHIYTLAGQRAYTRTAVVKKGANQLDAEIQRLPGGLYILEVTDSGGQHSVVKFRR